MNCTGIFVHVNGVEFSECGVPGVAGRYLDAGEFNGKDFYVKPGGNPATDYCRYEAGQWAVVMNGLTQYTNPSDTQYPWEVTGPWLIDDEQPLPAPVATRAVGTLQEALDQLYFPA